MRALRILIIVAGTLAFLWALVLDASETVIVPLWVFLLAQGMVLVGILRRFSLRRGMVALAILAVMMRLATVGLDQVGHRLQQVQIGMTKAEVRAIFAGYTEGTGITNLDSQQEFVVDWPLIFRNRGAEPGDANWAIISFTDGRVSSTSYSPD